VAHLINYRGCRKAGRCSGDTCSHG
jgi:hypothetical protein